MKRYIAYDQNGVKRAGGTGNTHTEAYAEAREAALDYIVDRPDTGPLAEWWILEKGEAVAEAKRLEASASRPV